MNEKNNVTELSFSDIIKMFKGKGRILVCIILLFSIVGISFTLIRENTAGHYGDTVEFYVSKTDKTENLMPFLRSESFAEKLFLDSNGLPPEELCDPDDYAAALDAINVYNAKRFEIKELNHSLEHFLYNVRLEDGTVTTWSELSSEYTKLQEECANVLNMLKLYKSANADAVAQDPNHLKKTAEYEAMLDEAFSEKKDFENNVYLPVLAKKTLFEQELSIGMYELKQLRQNAERLTEAVVAPWRNNSEVKNNVALAVKSLEISHESLAGGSENSDVTAFIKINVSVVGDKAFADTLIKKLCEVTPLYTERFIEKSSGSINSTCTLMTPYSHAKDINDKGIAVDCVKNAVIATVFALALYCFFVVSRNYVKRAMEE